MESKNDFGVARTPATYDDFLKDLDHLRDAGSYSISVTEDAGLTISFAHGDGFYKYCALVAYVRDRLLAMVNGQGIADQELAAEGVALRAVACLLSASHRALYEILGSFVDCGWHRKSLGGVVARMSESTGYMKPMQVTVRNSDESGGSEGLLHRGSRYLEDNLQTNVIVTARAVHALRL